MALLQSPLLETYGTLLLLKETLEKAKKNTILGTHVQKSKIEQTITKLESEVKESLKRKRHVPTKAPVSKMQRRGRHDVPRSRSWHRRREEEESADELDFERPGGKATLTDDDIYSLARWLASAEGRRYWGKQEQLDWAGFAKIRDRRGWRNWYIAHPRRKARIDLLTEKYKKELDDEEKRALSASEDEYEDSEALEDSVKEEEEEDL